MTPREIQTLINSIPECAALAVTAAMGKVEGGAYAQDKAIADILTARQIPRYAPARLTSLGLAAKFPALGQLPGPLASELVLGKLEAFAAAAAASQDMAARLFGKQIQRQMVHLANEAGLDFGDPVMHTMFDAIVAQGGLTQEEADAMKEVSVVHETFTPDQVSLACRGPWGDE